MRVTRRGLAIVLVSLLAQATAWAQQAPEGDGQRRSGREARERKRALLESARFEPLVSESVGIDASPAPAAVTPSSQRGDLDLQGYMFKLGEPFLHNIGGSGSGNTALGLDALTSATPGQPGIGDGESNTAIGERALFSNTTGWGNTAIGRNALHQNFGGDENTAVGAGALYFNSRLSTFGIANTAVGADALGDNRAGANNTALGWGAGWYVRGSNNTAIGEAALFNNQDGYGNTAVGKDALGGGISPGDRGSWNIAVGYMAGYNTLGDDNILIGNEGVSGEFGTIRVGTDGIQNQTFVAGIRGVAVTGGYPVLIDSGGQLGAVAPSSRSLKEDVQDMGAASSSLLELRPVTFRFRDEAGNGNRRLQYGLLAEEVAETEPELIVYADDGEVLGVRYHVLAPMLLNELQKQHQRLEAQKRLLAEQRRQLEQVRAEGRREVERLQARLTALEASHQRSDRVAALALE